MSSVDLDTADTVEFSAVDPVFVDPSGRRRKVLHRLVIGACVLVGVYVAVLAAALLGAPIPSSALLPLPAANAPKPEQPHSLAPSVGPSSDAPTSVPGREDSTTSDENGLPQQATAPPAPGSVVGTTPPGAVTGTPAAARPSDSRNSHAPTVPPGKDTTGRHP